ncbi:hypothetical protein F5X96DRAFT_552778 [Biscogniauxia mediterranea]|nr:hypothetical protein F5X96DRAFT_552778 [Biscogniauxia mediterranea]
MRSQPILLALATLFVSSVIAQDATTTDDDATTTAGTTDTAATTTAETTAETSEATTTAASTASETSTADDSDTTVPSITTTTSEASTTSASSTTGTTTVPGITSSAGGSLPTLPGSYSYPSPTVPPTSNAPFMHPSNAPEGTVFIAVGAILGAFGAAVLIWRAVIACLLHRSVKKAALAQHAANDKASYPAPSAPFYKYTDHASSASLGNMAAGGRGVRRTTRGPIPSSSPSQSNLFFSPTAPAGSNTAGSRESRFLPSGFYAAGAASPQQQTHGHSISLTNLRPDSYVQPRAVGVSPPESPGLAARTNIAQRNVSTSSLNLNQPPSQRAPSAFLEDLLTDQPEQFPPSGQHPGQHPSWNQSQNRI